MSNFTKEKAEGLRLKLASFEDTAKFFQEIDADLEMHRKNPRSKDSETVGFLRPGGKEVSDFLRDVFTEIENIEDFLSLLQFFGFKKGMFNSELLSDALVYFYKNKPGGFIYIQPAYPKSIQDSQFCLMYQRGKDGNPVLNISGTNGGRILAAEYQFIPLNGYYRTRLDIGLNEDESIRDYGDRIKTYEEYRNPSLTPLITQKMLTKAPLHKYILTLANEPVPWSKAVHLQDALSLQKYTNIPQTIPTK